MMAISSSARLLKSPSPVPKLPSCSLHREPNGLWAARTLTQLLEIANQIAPAAATAPAYCGLGYLLSMGGDLDYLAGHCVVVVPYRPLELYLTA